jgi:hypothetical protein
MEKKTRPIMIEFKGYRALKAALLAAQEAASQIAEEAKGMDDDGGAVDLAYSIVSDLSDTLEAAKEIRIKNRV